jgi:hypothetical protein
MITEGILTSWYSDNASRSFPLAESATAGIDDSGKKLPDCVLVGLELSIPSTMTAIVEPSTVPGIISEYHPFLSEVLISGQEIRVEVSAGTAGPVAAVTVPLASLEDFTNPLGFALSPLANDEPDVVGVGGVLVFGPVSGFLSAQGLYRFSFAEGVNTANSLLALDFIHPYPETIRSIGVDDVRLTGDVVIEAGENANISIDGDTITIGFDPGEVEGIHSVTELIDRLVEIWGQPITAINGIRPDNTGQYRLEVPDNGCVQIEQADHGLRLSNPCASPCCDKNALEIIMDNIQTLNSRYGRLYAYLTEAAGNLNTLQNDLSILKMSLKN